VVAAHNASAINRGPVGAGTSGRAGLSVNDFISKTKSQQRQGLKPSGPELIAYARYLGIDPVADHDLLWIAVEALEAPLPSDWTEHFDGSDRVFLLQCHNASQLMDAPFGACVSRNVQDDCEIPEHQHGTC